MVWQLTQPFASNSCRPEICEAGAPDATSPPLPVTGVGAALPLDIAAVGAGFALPEHAPIARTQIAPRSRFDMTS